MCLPNDFGKSLVSCSYSSRSLVSCCSYIYFVRIAVSYRTVFVSSSNRTGLYEVFSLFCTGYTGPFVGSYFSICVTGFVFVPGIRFALQRAALGFQYLVSSFASSNIVYCFGSSPPFSIAYSSVSGYESLWLYQMYLHPYLWIRSPGWYNCWLTVSTRKYWISNTLLRWWVRFYPNPHRTLRNLYILVCIQIHIVPGACS